MRAWAAVVCLTGFAVLSAGCDNKNVGTGMVAGGVAPDKGGAKVELTPGDFAAFDGAVRRHKGSVVVVDFWATWCPPCRESFPHLVALHNRYADLGLVCVSVSLDDAGNGDKVISFLKKQRAALLNFHWTDRTPADGRAFTERYRYGGGIPHMAVFGRDGERVWTSTEDHRSQAGVDQLVQDELNKK